MPIPEPGIYRPSKLTKEQRQQQLAAVYGVDMELSHAELERMRQIVKDHDQARQPMKTIDLNNPPKEPYKFQKFPKMVYGDGNLTMLVQSEDELQDAIADGYSEEAPVAGIYVGAGLSAANQAEAEAMQQKLEETRVKRAYTRKVVA